MSSYRGRKLGAMGKDYCPRCGANPTYQRWKPRSKPIDISVYERIDTFNPSDAIMCPNCGMGFQVSRLETDENFVVDWSILYDYVPNYCPQCGKPFPKEDGNAKKEDE